MFVAAKFAGIRSVLQCVAVCCSVLQCAAVCCRELQYAAARCSVWQNVAVCCIALQCGTVCCNVLQCVAVCCNVLHRLFGAFLQEKAYVYVAEIGQRALLPLTYHVRRMGV